MGFNWKQLPAAAEGYISYMRHMGDTDQPFVLFSCGTTVRVKPTDPELQGYLHSGYRFPDKMVPHAALGAILCSNRARLSAQRDLPSRMGRMVRQAYKKLIGQGYPYPGTTAAARRASPTGIVDDTHGMLWEVHWSNLDQSGEVFNLAFSATGDSKALIDGGELRRLDYMYPEVVGVILPPHSRQKRGTYMSVSDAPSY